jgi:hypothetical protein
MAINRRPAVGFAGARIVGNQLSNQQLNQVRAFSCVGQDGSSIRPNRAALLGPTMPLGTKESSLRGCLSACDRISSSSLHADGQAELYNRRVDCLGAHLIDRIRRGRNPPHQKIAARRCVALDSMQHRIGSPVCGEPKLRSVRYGTFSAAPMKRPRSLKRGRI